MRNKIFLLLIPLLILTLGATSTEEINQEKHYVISTCAYKMGKDTWIFETKMNSRTGKIISRKQIHSKKYRNIK